MAFLVLFGSDILTSSSLSSCELSGDQQSQSFAYLQMNKLVYHRYTGQTGMALIHQKVHRVGTVQQNSSSMGRGPFNGHSRDVNCVTFSPDTSWSDDKMIRFWELCTRKERSAIVKETLIVLEKSSLVNDRGNGLFTDGCKRDKDGWLSGGRSELLFWTPPHNYSTPENEVKKKNQE